VFRGGFGFGWALRCAFCGLIVCFGSSFGVFFVGGFCCFGCLCVLPVCPVALAGVVVCCGAGFCRLFVFLVVSRWDVFGCALLVCVCACGWGCCVSCRLSGFVDFWLVVVCAVGSSFSFRGGLAWWLGLWLVRRFGFLVAVALVVICLFLGLVGFGLFNVGGFVFLAPMVFACRSFVIVVGLVSCSFGCV